jgi:hypothetical protein
VGSVRRELISSFKRVNKFAMEDYGTLRRVIDYFGQVLTTPNILTEVSNLAGQLSGDDRDRCFERFAATLTKLKEEYIPSNTVAQTKPFKAFGITDAGIVHIAERGHLIITDDFPLYHLLISSRLDALNFNHISSMNWKV